jgi:hypothetical protein
MVLSLMLRLIARSRLIVITPRLTDSSLQPLKRRKPVVLTRYHKRFSDYAFGKNDPPIGPQHLHHGKAASPPLRLKRITHGPLTLASNTYRRELSRLVLMVSDELVAPLVLALTLGVISRGPVRSEYPLLTGTSRQWFAGVN